MSYALLHPVDGVRWGHNLVARRSPIHYRLPWMPWPCVRFLDGWLRPEHSVFEWGAGGSTLFFLDRGCKVVTAENSPEWIANVSHKLRPGSEPRWKPILAHEPQAYVNAIRSVPDADVVLVDGLLDCRMQSIAAVLRYANPKLIVLDDSWRDEYAETPDVLNAYDRLTFTGLGPARLGITQADIYLSRRTESMASDAQPEAVVEDAL